MEKCQVFELKELDKARFLKEKISPKLNRLWKEQKIIDYFYAHYSEIFKFCLFGVTDNIAVKLREDLAKEGIVLPGPKPEDFDISKILACCGRKITDHLEEVGISKIDSDSEDKFVAEIAKSEINAEAYAPLHWVFNQLKVDPCEEVRIREKIKTHPDYKLVKTLCGKQYR
jgi:hypothetical protein